VIRDVLLAIGKLELPLPRLKKNAPQLKLVINLIPLLNKLSLAQLDRVLLEQMDMLKLLVLNVPTERIAEPALKLAFAHRVLPDMFPMQQLQLHVTNTIQQKESTLVVYSHLEPPMLIAILAIQPRTEKLKLK